jgi:polar amino acid transport system permease protein
MSIDTDVIVQALPLLLKGLKVTAAVSLVGITIGLVIGAVAAYMADSAIWVFKAVARAYVECVRNIPFLILVYLAFFGLPKLGLHFSAHAIGIGASAFYTGGYFCEIARAALRSVPRGQVAAARSLGMNAVQVQRHVVIPQTFSFLLPPTVSLMIMMFKDSAIFSVMSLPELTYQSNLMTADTFAYVEVLGTTALIYWACSIVFDTIGRRLEKILVIHHR